MSSIFRVSFERRLAIVVIPIYKKLLNSYEKISLAQLDKVLYKYPKVFVAPASLIVDYGDEYADWKVERFPDRYFVNTETYSELCLSPEFYERFLSYRYMLIYQTDAFVFSDRLEEFCSMGYDYIGAPSPISVWRFLKTRVGNGGLSLRNVEKTLHVLKYKDYVLQKASEIYTAGFLKKRLSIEDQFFAYSGTLSELGFHVPGLAEAREFAMWSEVQRSYHGSAFHLPFGCHGWHNTHFLFWWAIIQSYGYHLDEDVIQRFAKAGDAFRESHVKAYLFERFLRKRRGNTKYSVWGYGINGHKCIDLLKAAGIEVVTIYDIHAGEIENDTDIPFRKPVDAELKLKQTIIIIATAKYELEISHHLEALGLQRNVDFVTFYSVKTYKALGCKRG